MHTGKREKKRKRWLTELFDCPLYIVAWVIKNILCETYKPQMSTSLTAPAPTVLPPSRMANLKLSSIMTGKVSSNCNSTSSPIVKKTRKHAVTMICMKLCTWSTNQSINQSIKLYFYIILNIRNMNIYKMIQIIQSYTGKYKARYVEE